jgi:hypothetical protein
MCCGNGLGPATSEFDQSSFCPSLNLALCERLIFGLVISNELPTDSRLDPERREVAHSCAQLRELEPSPFDAKLNGNGGTGLFGALPGSWEPKLSDLACNRDRYNCNPELMESGGTSRIAPTVLALLLLFGTSMMFSRTSLELNRGFGVNGSLDAAAIA